MKNPLVSVCCVTYNQVSYIEKTIKGFLLQKTDFPFEICIGEDGSNDGTREICEEYYSRYPEIIRLFKRNRADVVFNNGEPTARYNFIETVKKCRGKYIAFCDGDDFWNDPYKLEKQTKVLETNDGYVGVATNGVLLNDLTNKTKPHYANSIKEYFSKFDLLNGNPFLTSSVLYRTVIIKNFLNKLKDITAPAGDYHMHVYASQFGLIGFLPDLSTTYRIHNSGIWQKKSPSQSLGSAIIVAKSINQKILKDFYSKWLIRRYIGRLHGKLGSLLFSQGKYLKAFYVSLLSIMYPLPSFNYRFKIFKQIIFIIFKILFKKNG